MIMLLYKFADWVDDYGMCTYLILAIIQIDVFAFVFMLWEKSGILVYKVH